MTNEINNPRGTRVHSPDLRLREGLQPLLGEAGVVGQQVREHLLAGGVVHAGETGQALDDHHRRIAVRVPFGEA